MVQSTFNMGNMGGNQAKIKAPEYLKHYPGSNFDFTFRV
jgi:hypothetical protein